MKIVVNAYGANPELASTNQAAIAALMALNERARRRLQMLADRGLIRRERRDDQPAPTVCYWPVEDWRP